MNRIAVIISLCALFYVASANNGTAKKHKLVLPFLINATQKQKDEFITIFGNNSMTRAEQNKTLGKWLHDQPGTIEKDFYEFMDTYRSICLEIQKHLSDPSIDPKLKDSFQKISNIHDDTSLTNSQMMQKISEVLRNLSPEELNKIAEIGSRVKVPEKEAY
ncbi:hypothetical protein AB6A40_008752 [Gnathostoma spinigerum]|uniref:SXP/RAL-2 family protein Ani s 5-like cation-binding domain-containing protein n=1 Tax=Gnathostoma spinigerum TaxID=75299 RepID=A0ABD6EQ09_9BILA